MTIQEKQDELEKHLKSLLNEVAFEVKLESLPPQQEFLSIHKNEWERRMEEYAKMGQQMPFGDLGGKKKTIIVNTNHALAGKLLAKEEAVMKEQLQYHIDLALLEKNLLQGADLERFIQKSKSFLQD